MSDQQGPTPEDIRRQEELNRLTEENNRLLREARETQREQSAISNGLIDDLKEVLGIRSRTTQAEKQTLKLNTDINNAVNKQVTGYGTVKSLTKDIEKNQKLISQAANKTRGIEENLGKTQTKRLNAARNLADEITNQNDKVEEMQAAMLRGEAIDQKELRAEKEKLVGLDERFAALQKNLSTEAQQVLLTEQQQKALEKVTAEMAKELELQKKIENSFGVFGGVAKALGQLPVIGGAFTGALTNAKGRVAEIAKETGKIPSKLQRANIFAQEFSGIAAKASLGFIMQQALKLNKSFVETGRTLGVSRSEIRGINQELRDTEAASNNIYTTDTERLATLNRISQTLGLNAQILGNENIAGAARLQQSLGLSAEEADALAMNSGLAGDNIVDATKEIIATNNEFNKGNKTLYSSRKTIQDVAKVSTTLKTIYGNNTKELTKSVLAAKQLGLTLDEVSAIGDKLLDFESSIAAEMEAELLTGKQLNLEKARQAALNNDLKTLSEELVKNGVTSEKFTKMNRIEQEALAKSLGMTNDQLAKSVQQEDYRRLSKEKFAELHGKETLESMEQLEVQQKLEKSLARMAEAVTPIAEGMANLLSNTEALSVILGVIVFGQLTKFIARLTTITGINLAQLALKKKTAKESKKEAVSDTVSAGAEVASSAAKLPIAGAFLAVGLAAGVIGYLMGQLNKADDLKSMGGYGKRTLLAPDGAFALNDNDNILATTNDLPTETPSTLPGGKKAPAAEGGGGGKASVDMGPVVAAINELIATVKAGGTIEIDGQAVGRAVTLVDYQTGGG